MRWLLALLLIPALALAQGVNSHVQHGEYSADRALSAMGTMGLKSVRAAYYWSHAEYVKGTFQPDTPLRELEKQLAGSSSPLLVFCCGNGAYAANGFPITGEYRAGFLRYVKWVATRFKGRVFEYELWNEWNIGGHSYTSVRYGDPLQYADLLREVYAAVKAIDPNARVIAGAVSGWDSAWTEKLMATGAPMDGISIHPYAYPHIPEKHIDYLAQFQGMVNRYKPGLPIYVSEIGWPDFNGTQGVSEWRAAAYLSRFYLLMPTVAQVKGVWWYALVNNGTDPANREHNFGLVRQDFTLKEAACTMQRTQALLQGARYVSAGTITKGTDKFRRVTYALADGYVHAIWAEGDPLNILVSAEGARETLCAGHQVSVGVAASIYVGHMPVVIHTRTPTITLE
jgi:hypothetical protein